MNPIEKRFFELKEGLKDISANQILQRAATVWPDRIALICGDQQITYQKLFQQTIMLGKKLLNLLPSGSDTVKPGDRVLIIYENSINFYKAYYAAWQIGAIVTPLNVYLNQHELEHIIHDSKPKLIIASEKQKEKLQKLAPEKVAAPIISEAFFVEEKQDTEEKEMYIAPQDQNACTVLLYTSGTTGIPKGVMFSSRMILTNCLQGVTNFAITERERVYAALPLFHSYMQNAAVWSPFIVGAAVIVIPFINRTHLINGLTKNPTIIVGIPQLYGLFALMKTLQFPQVKLFVSGGDSLQNKIRMGFEFIYNRKLVDGYGLTETGPFIAVDIDDIRHPAGCVGKPMIKIQAEIRDNKGEKSLHCQDGVLWIKGDNVTLGYYNAPEPTAKILKNGWINTGDIAYITNDNYIVLQGRERDLISHKGVKIYPPEVENVLTMHPDINMAGVIGTIHNGIEYPVAFVASKASAEKIIPELKKLCQNNLAAYKVPIEFYVRTILPTTATGKVDKKILRQDLIKIQEALK